MISNDIDNKIKLIEKSLRQFGIDGENAFYYLLFQYYLAYSPKLNDFPKTIISKYSRLSKIVDDKTKLALASVINGDPTGSVLPIWYQYFLSKMFRENSGKFFTPHPVATAMSDLLPLKENAIIMDPTCGGGTFLVEVSKRFSELSCHLIGNDIDPALIYLTNVVLGLNTPKRHTKTSIVSNIFLPNLEFKRWFNKVDFILANPPFSLKISSIEGEGNLFNIGYRNSDALFLDVCLTLLKPRGMLVCLLPHSIVANRDFQNFRIEIEKEWQLLGIIGMPEGVFYTTANTSTRADIVMLQKNEEQSSKKEAFFAFAPSVGVPLNSRNVIDNENFLEKIVKETKIKEITSYY